MEHILNFASTFLDNFALFAIEFFEYIGVFILVISGIKAFSLYLKRSPLTRITLARDMALALEFKLGGEILRTVTLRDTNELIIVGGLILLRSTLAFLIHWEIKTEEKSHKND